MAKKTSKIPATARGGKRKATTEADKDRSKRIEAQADRLATWSFAEKFPVLAAANLEIKGFADKLSAERPDLNGDALVKVVEGWRKGGVQRKDFLDLRILHLAHLANGALSLASAAAHAIATNEELRDFEDECVKETADTQQNKLAAVRLVLDDLFCEDVISIRPATRDEEEPSKRGAA